MRSCGNSSALPSVLLRFMSTGARGGGAGVDRAPKDINMRSLPNMVSSIPLYWAFEPECEIPVSMWSFGPLVDPILQFQMEPCRCGDEGSKAVPWRSWLTTVVMSCSRFHSKSIYRSLSTGSPGEA